MNKDNSNKLKINILMLFLLLGAVLMPSLKANAETSADDFINRCYLVTVGREADSEGFEYWNNRIVNSELVGTQVAYGFVFSDEYQNKDKSNEEYVTDLYMLFLGREPDEEGFNNWVNALEEGKSRLSVFAGFANSNEFYNLCEACGITAGYFTDECDNERLNGINLFTDRLYRICLGRQGEREGQEYWVKALLKGELTGTDCASGFANSPEYRNNGLTDIEYVENMYKACLGRNSEKDGLKYWVTALANGLTRDELFEGFANSDEFEGICAKYGIIRGTYIASDKGTYDPQNPDLIPVDIPDNPNNEEPDIPEQHIHQYKQMVKDPEFIKSPASCTKPAEYYYSCICGKFDENDSFVSGKPLGHDWDEGIITKDASEEKDGIITYK
ncbi:MAG: DUF4214 domain-containing protein, partial [Lachnospiraceae bacterium]|nr:DUF4214 domain-containing protein [Lachnospiraceae bacterium]